METCVQQKLHERKKLTTNISQYFRIIESGNKSSPTEVKMKFTNCFILVLL